MKVSAIAVILATLTMSSTEAKCGFKGPWPELDTWARALPEGDRDKIDDDQECNSIDFFSSQDLAQNLAQVRF